MKIKKLLFATFKAFLFAVVVSGCKGNAVAGGSSSDPLKSLALKVEGGKELEKKQLKDSGLQLVAMLEPSNADVNLQWESSDANKATVNELGYVSFKNAGEVAIKVTDKKSSISASFTFAVEEPAGEEDTSIKIKGLDYYNKGWTSLPSAVDRVFTFSGLKTMAKSVSVKLRVRPENPSLVDKLMFKVNEDGSFETANKNNAGNYEITCNGIKKDDKVIVLRLISGARHNDYRVNLDIAFLDVKLLSDKDFDIKKSKGEKATLLIFTQDTCGACERAYEHSVELYKKYHSKGLNVFVFMQINTGSEMRGIEKMIQYGIPYPCYTIGSSSYVASIWQNVLYTPWAYLMDGDEKVIINTTYANGYVENEIAKLCN